MVRIFRSKAGQYVIQTTALDAESFIADLAEAMAKTEQRHDGDDAVGFMEILRNAMPIAFKLSGYKAENVTEQRTLVCGSALPTDSEVIASAGR